MPHRYQLSRKRGWRLPPNTISVARPGRYGNPHMIRDRSPAERLRVIQKYRSDLKAGLLEHTEYQLERKLCGLNVACYCRTDEECHGDVILEVANRSAGQNAR